MKPSQLHKKIMKRIWYIYAFIQIKNQLTTKAFWQGLVFGVSLLVFADKVHVASVLQNTLATPLGRVPQYAWTTILEAMQTGGLIKVITLLFLVSILVSLLKKVTPIQIQLIPKQLP